MKDEAVSFIGRNTFAFHGHPRSWAGQLAATLLVTFPASGRFYLPPLRRYSIPAIPAVATYLAPQCRDDVVEFCGQVEMDKGRLLGVVVSPWWIHLVRFTPMMPDETFRDSSSSFEAGEPQSASARAALPVDGLDPLIIAASVEVDRTLLRWMLTLSPRARLRASTKATRTLARFRRGSS